MEVSIRQMPLQFLPQYTYIVDLDMERQLLENQWVILFDLVQVERVSMENQTN